MKHQAIFLAMPLFFLAAFFGCAQGGPAECGSAPPEKLANCIYVKAVMDQNPFSCYSLEDTNQRARCIKDASDPAVRTSLQSALPEQRDSIFAEPVPSPSKANATIAPEPEPPKTAPASPLEQCNSFQPPDADQCMRAIAIESKDIAACNGVRDRTTKQNCITQVAKMVKSPAICGSLSSQDDINLCNLYAKAGEG